MTLDYLFEEKRTIELSQMVKFHLQNKVVLITGAAGSIGREISKILTFKLNCTLVLLDQAELPLYELQEELFRKGVNCKVILGSICDPIRMNDLFNRFNFDIVYHAAAYKHVSFMEKHPYEAIRVNIGGTRIVSDLAVKYNTEKFVFVSTDKAVNPTNVMGASKRIAEMYINCLQKSGTTKFVITRFGNVMGSSGSVFPLFKKQIENGGPILVTHKEINRFFMTVQEACQLVLEAGALGNGGEIFVFDMGESIKIFDLAVDMIRRAGLNYPNDIDIEITGLRPGEKINEELLTLKENISRTQNKKIMIASVELLNVIEVNKEITDLIELNKESNIYKTIEKMKEILPEFISNNPDLTE
jgi:FlaA1/EpsC-like NDP-sugar epimerase